MSAENKAVVRRLIDAFNRGDLDDGAAQLADGYVYHGPSGDTFGPLGWKELAGVYRSAFPDVTMIIDQQIAEGDTVATRCTARGTHRGELAGVPASGRYVTVPILMVSRVINGKIVEDFEQFDQLTMFQAIGRYPAIPASV